MYNYLSTNSKSDTIKDLSVIDFKKFTNSYIFFNDNGIMTNFVVFRESSNDIMHVGLLVKLGLKREKLSPYMRLDLHNFNGVGGINPCVEFVESMIKT